MSELTGSMFVERREVKHQRVQVRKTQWGLPIPRSPFFKKKIVGDRWVAILKI